MLSILRMYGKAHLLIAGTGYRSENVPFIPRMYIKTHLLTADAGYRSENVTSIPRIYVKTHLLTAEVGYMSKKLSSIPCAVFIQGIELYALLRPEVGCTYQLHCLECLCLDSA